MPIRFAIFLCCAFWALPASAAHLFCPGCVPTVNETYAEIVTRCDVVLLAQWTAAEPLTDDDPAYTEFKIAVVGKERFIESEESAKDDEPKQPAGFKPEQMLKLDQYRSAKPGDLYLLMGTRGAAETIDWEPPVEITETEYHYVMQAPSREVPQTKRLTYFLKFLESSNQFIGDDAYNEFALAAFEDVATLVDVIPAQKVRKWIADPETQKTHLGLYGILLGLSGTRDDAELLKSAFIDKRNEYSLGVEGIITGYLFLTGGEGVRTLERDILRKPGADTDEVYPVLQALDLVWIYGGDRVPKEDLIHAMRTLLDHESVCEFAVVNLSRWKDWDSTERLIAMYEAGGPDTDNLQKSILSFMLTAARATKTVDGESQPIPQAELAAKFVDRVRADDPEAVERVERLVRPRTRPRPSKSDS